MKEEKVEFLTDLIQAHRRGHSNSNSPYGHICEPRCLASTIEMFYDDWQPGAYVSYDGSIKGLKDRKSST